MHQDTIYALATPLGRSGVAVIRVSGPEALTSFTELTTIINPKFRYAYFHPLVHPVSRETIDECLILCFQQPKSYTGEYVVEYHMHGSVAVIHELLEVLGQFDNHRMAEPGEFTRRSFENGKMDLTQAEAVADLIDAETSLQKAQALHQIHGALTVIYERWSEILKKNLAYMEAEIEFPDEDDPQDYGLEISPMLDTLITEISEHLNDNRRGERLRDGIKVAIVGAPNAGKSSLMNTLVQRDAVIVSNTPGTTRDTVDVHLDLNGIPIILTDTAGIRYHENSKNPHDEIEAIGVERAIRASQLADIKILLFDGMVEKLDPHTLSLIDENSIVAISKADQHILCAYNAPAIQISCVTQEGIKEIIDALIEKATGLVGKSEIPSITRERHRQAVEDVLQSLMRAKNALESALPELIAEDLRLAIRHLGRITGKVDVEDLLDVIFKDFCIGK